jgi:hypothetical protein
VAGWDLFANPLGQPQGPQPIQNPSPEQQSDIAGQWRNFMGNESNRAAMLQFGLNMMQPVGLGQTPLGHTAQAIGAAGETFTRQGEEERRERELGSKEELRSAQATAAEARAARAGTAAGAAGERAERSRERLAFDREKFGTQNLLRLQQQYIRMSDQIRKDNELLPEGRRRPVPAFEEWIGTQPHLAGVPGVPQGGAPTPTEPPAAGGATPVPAPAGGDTPPISSLQEGKRTRFRNGQVWTLEGGQPRRVQ